jgi:glucose-1-phosphate thymidylyltransferase
MKGIILAGGLGTRLWPLTSVCNKCLLPIYDRPMIYYPIQNLVKAGITDILLVCGGNAAGEFLRILGNGEDFGLKHLHYTYQREPRGIADALGLAEEFVGGEPMAVILADNIFENSFKAAVDEFEKDPVGARIFLTEVDHPEHYGVVEVDSMGHVISVVEKPEAPKSNMIATGLYMYDNTVWNFIKELSPSARGELEITDVNNHYLDHGQLKSHMVDGEWFDCGEDFDGLLKAQVSVKKWNLQTNS